MTDQTRLPGLSRLFKAFRDESRQGERATLPAGREADDLAVLDPTAAAVMITLIEVDESLVEEIIRKTKTYFAGKRIVFVTDSASFKAFRTEQVIFEYFPSLLEQTLHRNALPWPSYMAERWALLQSKWRPQSILSYGRNIDSFIAAAPAPESGGRR